MPLIPLQIPPGVYKNGTEYQSKGRWNDSNLVRWFENTIRPVGGWRKRSTSQATGKARGMHLWRDNSGDRWIGVGTHSNLYVMNEAGTFADITPTGFTSGNADAVLNIGYGKGTYGSYAYGTARPDIGSYEAATTWSLDNWGEYLLGCSSKDGKIYEWQLNTATDAAAVTNAPTGCAGIIVTEERIVMALGASGNPRKVAWCDQENNTVWTASATNKAGDYELQTAGSIQCGKRMRGQVLIFTDIDAHSSTYIGSPYVYSFEKVGTGCGVISKTSPVNIDNACVWMSKSGFWIYDGFVKPLMSDVSDYVFKHINTAQQSKIYGFHNSTYGEVWWLYPSDASVELDSYVSYNYREGHWAIGKIDRTCAADKGIFTTPLMMSADGYVYEHETGFDYGSATPYAESGPVEIASGDRLIDINQIIPDENTLGDVQVRFATKFYPTGTKYNYGPYSMNNPTSLRISGRQLAARIEGARFTDWRVGVMRVNGKQGSGR